MSGLLGEVYTELYRAVHRALSTILNNGVSAFQGEAYTGRIGPIVGTLESVRIIKVSTFQGCPQGGVPLYTYCIVYGGHCFLNTHVYMRLWLCVYSCVLYSCLV